MKKFYFETFIPGIDNINQELSEINNDGNTGVESDNAIKVRKGLRGPIRTIIEQAKEAYLIATHIIEELLKDGVRPTNDNILKIREVNEIKTESDEYSKIYTEVLNRLTITSDTFNRLRTALNNLTITSDTFNRLTTLSNDIAVHSFSGV